MRDCGVTKPFTKLQQRIPAEETPFLNNRNASTGRDANSCDSLGGCRAGLGNGRCAAVFTMAHPTEFPIAKAQEARERAAQAIAKAQNIPVEQARTQVQQYEQQYRAAVAQAKDKATQVADAASKAVSRGALFGSLALLLGAIAGWLGGRMGAVEPTITARMGLSPIASGPVGHATATVKGTGGRRSTSEPVSRRS
jgi:hypothetical protein